MRIRLFTVALVALAAILGLGGPGGSAELPLGAALTESLRAPDLPLGRTAAIAVDTTTGQVLYAHNAGRAFVPASNAKLPVAWAALTRLGPQFRYATELRGVGTRSGTTWNGDLVLVGSGDPTLSRADFGALAATVRARGIRRVTGRIIGDESAFDTTRAAPGWKPSFLGVESPPLSALVVDRARGWPKNSPPVLAARVLREELVARKIEVPGAPWFGTATSASVVLADHNSRPLGSIVQEMNRESDNFVAEMLLKRLAVSAGRIGTTAAGARVVIDEMRAAAIPLRGVRLADGSGLSRLDRLTPLTLVGILRAGLENPAISRAFVGSLAVAGRNGTLEDRLSPLAGRVVGKTGTTSLACSLSGLVHGTIAFAVIQNGTPVPSWSARAAQDRFVQILAARA